MKFTKKRPPQIAATGPFLLKVSTSQREDFITCIYLGILRNLLEQLFYKIPMSSCFSCGKVYSAKRNFLNFIQTYTGTYKAKFIFSRQLFLLNNPITDVLQGSKYLS